MSGFGFVEVDSRLVQFLKILGANAKISAGAWTKGSSRFSRFGLGA